MLKAQGLFDKRYPERNTVGKAKGPRASLPMLLRPGTSYVHNGHPVATPEVAKRSIWERAKGVVKGVLTRAYSEQREREQARDILGDLADAADHANEW